MGNFWKGISDEAYYDCERRMLKYSGIPLQNFKLSNVVIDEEGNYIRTIEVGDKSNQHLVLIHGYGGSGIIFWKVMKALSEKFYLILIDIIGMGGSS
jgi:hypothetical protein